MNKCHVPECLNKVLIPRHGTNSAYCPDCNTARLKELNRLRVQKHRAVKKGQLAAILSDLSMLTGQSKQIE